MAAGVSEPMMQTGSQEDMDRVLWEINALMAQEPPVGDRFKTAPVRPAPCPIQPPTSHVNISGISLEMGDLAMLASRPAHIAPPASAPAFMTNFGAVFPDAYPATAPAFDLVDPFNSIPLPSVYPLAPQATTPLLFPGQSLAYGAEPAWLPNPYLVQRRASASVPLIHRPRSAPIVPSLQASRRASTPSSHKKVAKKTSFVNFSAKDATKLLTAVAPSGSSKRKREEEEAAAADQAAKRRVVSAPF